MPTTRVTRSQKKQQESIVEKLSSKERKRIEKTILQLQSIYRGKKTRKNLPKITKDIEAYKEKKYKESIGPKYYKTLKELSGEKVNKIISSIFTNYKIEDEDVKKLLVSNILFDKTLNEIDTILSSLITIYKYKLKLVNEMSNNLNTIISYSIYPSSADEEEREIIDEEFFYEKAKLRDKISNIAQEYNKVNIFFNKIKELLIKILKLINADDFVNVLNFLDLLNIDWYEQLDKSDSYRNNSTFELDEKINFVKKNFLTYKEKAFNKISNILQEKLSKSQNIKIIIDEIANHYNNVIQLNDKYKELTTIKKSKKSTRRR